MKTPSTSPSKFLMLYLSHEHYEENRKNFLASGTTHKNELDMLLADLSKNFKSEDTGLWEISREWDTGSHIIYEMEIFGFIGLPKVSEIPEYQFSFQETWYLLRDKTRKHIPVDIQQWITNRRKKEGITENKLGTRIQQWILDNYDVLDRSNMFNKYDKTGQPPS